MLGYKRNLALLFTLLCVSSTFADGLKSCEALLGERLFDRRKSAKDPELQADRGKSEKISVYPNQKMQGVVQVDPAKNAYLPILAASVLSSGPIYFKNLPMLRDIESFLEILKFLGAEVSVIGNLTKIDPRSIQTNKATCELVRTLRASVVLMGPLTARFKGAMVGLPGGCPIGSRPINFHIEGLRRLGAYVVESGDSVSSGSIDSSGLVGAEYRLPFPSVGATQSLVMAATLAKGQTILKNVALEPEVEDVFDFLNAMGADVQSDGRGTVVINGKASLPGGITYEAIGDRIEAATYIMAALMSQSEITVTGFTPSHIESVLDTLRQMGAELEIGADYVKVLKSPGLRAVDIVTGPHPQFPTDAQAQIMALMTQADGTSSIKETVFENRFQHVHELNNMGAKISVDGKVAKIEGPTPLHPAKVRCTDLRGGAALIASALVANQGIGQDPVTELSDTYYVHRGYYRILEKLNALGICQVSRTPSL